jgi:hypothetical protein
VCVEYTQFTAGTHLPKHYHAVIASRGEPVAIGRESDGVEWLTPLECPEFSLGANIPEFCSAILAGRREQAAIGGKTDSVDAIGMSELQKHFGCGFRNNDGRM